MVQAARKTDGPLGMLVKTVQGADVVLEIVDARFPNVSKRVAELCKRHQKKLIVVYNKADLLPEKTGRNPGAPYSYFSAKEGGKYRARLVKLIYAVSKGSKFETVRVAVVGYPNTGKSSVINALSHRKSLSVSAEAGHTKSVQWIRVGRILLSDTPGVITERAPKETLVLSGNLNIEREADPVAICDALLKTIFSDGRLKASFFEHYKIPPCEMEEALEKVAIRRGRFSRGGELNLPEAARIIVSEWQRGKII